MATGTETERPAPVPLRRNRNFQLLWFGEAVSALGSSASFVAIPLLLLKLTGSAALAGTVATVRRLVGLAVRLPAGVLVDRVDRRRVMLACDVLALVAAGALALAVALHRVSPLAVAVVAIVIGTVSVAFFTAESVAIGTVVPLEQIAPATAVNQARSAGVSLAGPPVGGILYAVNVAAPFIADAASYLVSLLAITGLRGEFRPVRKTHGRMRDDIVEGLQFAWREHSLRTIMIVAALANLAFDGLGFGLIVVLRQTGHSAQVIGLALAVIGAGALVGSVIAGWLSRRLSLGAMLVFVCAGGAVAILVGAAIVPSALVTVPIALVMTMAPAFSAALEAFFFAVTPDHLRGRAQAALGLGATSLALPAPLIVGTLLDLTSAHLALGVFAAPLVVATGLSARLARTQRAEPMAG